MTLNFTRLKYIFGKINYSQRCRKLGQRPKTTRAMHYVIYLPTLSIDSNKEEHHFKRFVGWLSPFRLDEYGLRVGRPFSIGSTPKARVVMYFLPKFISIHFPFQTRRWNGYYLLVAASFSEKANFSPNNVRVVNNCTRVPDTISYKR